MFALQQLAEGVGPVEGLLPKGDRPRSAPIPASDDPPRRGGGFEPDLEEAGWLRERKKSEITACRWLEDQPYQRMLTVMLPQRTAPLWSVSTRGFWGTSHRRRGIEKQGDEEWRRAITRTREKTKGSLECMLERYNLKLKPAVE